MNVKTKKKKKKEPAGSLSAVAETELHLTTAAGAGALALYRPSQRDGPQSTRPKSMPGCLHRSSQPGIRRTRLVRVHRRAPAHVPAAVRGVPTGTYAAPDGRERRDPAPVARRRGGSDPRPGGSPEADARARASTAQGCVEAASSPVDEARRRRARQCRTPGLWQRLRRQGEQGGVAARVEEARPLAKKDFGRSVEHVRWPAALEELTPWRVVQ